MDINGSSDGRYIRPQSKHKSQPIETTKKRTKSLILTEKTKRIHFNTLNQKKNRSKEKVYSTPEDQPSI